MTPSRPYLLRAIYEWLLDNQLTPYIMVDATQPEVAVPTRYIDDGKIILNIEPQAVGTFRMGNDAVEFDAKFSGVPYHIFIPVPAIKAIYAYENGRGMVFPEEETEQTPPPSTPAAPSATTQPAVKKGKPELKIIK